MYLGICVYLFISVHMRKYLLLSVCIRSIYVHICAYLCVSGLYLCIFAYICVYLSISVYISKLIFRRKKTNLKKKIFGFKSVLRTGRPVRSPKIENSHVHTRIRSRDLPLPGNSPNHLANTAVHICQTIRYIFSKNVHICLYMSIHVHMRAYVCIYRSYPKSGRV